MKSIIRLGVLVLVALVAFGPIATIHAQGPNNCFGAPAEDCKLFTTAFESANTAKFAQGFAMDYKLNAKFNVGGASAQNGSVDVTGTGAFGLNTTAMSSGSSDPMSALAGLMFSNVIKASSSDNGKTQEGSIEIRIVNGNVYFMSEQLTQGKWQYVSMSDAFTAAMSMQSSMASSGSAGGLGSFNSARTCFKSLHTDARVS